jgi:hypothetical protein
MPTPVRSIRLGRAVVFSVWLVFQASCADTGEPGTATPISADMLMAHITFLADDSLYGRPAGWEDELRAAEYVRTTFTGAGLSPGAPEYFQTFWIGPQVVRADEAPDATPAGPAGGPDRVPRSYSQNVIATLPGRGVLADEWVVVGAHYDHVGWTIAPDSSLQIFNGADDNASGTAVLLEVARYLAERDAASSSDATRRSLMFVGWGAEEIGLVGSRFFCETPTVPLARVAAMVNLDMVGRLRDALQIRAAGSARWWADVVREANTEGLTVDLDPDPIKGGSDHLCFLSAGRPAVHLFTGLHAEYHTPADDPPLINRDGLREIANLTAQLVEVLAATPSLAVE